MNYKTIKLVLALILMVSDLITREFDAALHVDKSPKIEAKLGDRRNKASSQSYVYFIMDRPQGFSP